MDLPTCPSCQQSVLDEDAQECPFCGASMKGGSPAPKSAPPKPAPAAKTPPKEPARAAGKSAPPAVNPAAPQRAAKEPAKPEDDDPFAVDSSVGAKAIAVSAQGGGGRTLEVTCPMCETTGYVSPKASGQMVKCCNPKCLVPIFQAPVIEKPAPPPAPPPKKQLPVALYAGIGVVAVVAIGGLAYVFLGGTPTPKPDSIVPPVTTGGTGTGSTDVAADTGTSTSTDKTATGTDDAAKIAAARDALLKKSLKGAVEAALNADQARKPYGRRLAAVAYVSAGDINSATEQLQQLKKIGKTAPHEAILPLVAIGWAQLPKDEAGFRKSIDEAHSLVGQLPNRGRYAVEASIALAAGMCAAGKADEARKLISSRHGTPQQDQLAAVLQVTENRKVFDVDAKLPARTFGEWQFPLETAVTLVLAAHGRWDDATAWVKSLDASARPEATVAFAETLARESFAHGKDADIERAAALGNDQPAAVKAWLLARLADVCLTNHQQPKAEEYLTQASATLKMLSPPEPVRLEGVKAIMEYKAPDALPLQQAAKAAAEIAGVQARLKQPDRAWEAMQTALQFLRGSAPGFSLMKERTDQIANQQNAARDELKTAFDLKTNDLVIRQFAKYKPVCAALFGEASTRFRGEVSLLESAVEWGLLDPVMQEIMQADAEKDLNANKPFLATGLPWLLAQKFAEAGDKENQSALVAAAKPRLSAADPASVVAAQATGLVASGDVKTALQRLNGSMADTGVLHEVALRLACRLVNAGKTKEAVQLVAGLKDIILKEDGLRLISALAARRGHFETLAKQTSSMRLSPSETGNVDAGLVLGLTAGSTDKQ